MAGIIVNMGKMDRVLRTLFGTVLVIISRPFLDIVPGDFLSYFCLVFGAINIVSSVVGWCFMYRVVGMDTCPKRRT